MTLDASYLEYPMRRHGMDHDRYGWSALPQRPAINWPQGKAVAIPIVVSLEWFPILPEDKPFRAPGHMVTPYPDYRHYTSREYGTRVGLFRLLDTFAKHGVKASIAMNSAIATRYPEIVESVTNAGHEIVAHATDMNATIAGGVSPERQAEIVTTSLDEIEAAFGTRPKGWLSIARSQAFETPDVLAGAGIEYMLDWVNDELPYRFATKSGSIINLPLNHELSDRQIITVTQQSIDSYATQIEDACDWLEGEAATHSGRMLPLHLTPYITGLPYRIDALDALIGRLGARDTTLFATTGSLVAAADEQLPR